MKSGSELLTVKQMSNADALAVEAGVPSLTLMENAGVSVVREIRRHWTRRRVAVLCGPGNNGGDGFVVARLLQGLNWPVRLGLLVDKSKLTGDAAVNADAWDGDCEPLTPALLDGAELVLDALFGAGLARDIDGAAAELIAAINDSGVPVVAVDTPSGVDGNTGEVRGIAPQAALTVTFFRKKPGHLLMPGRSLCGETVVTDIGIPASVLEELNPVNHENGPALWREVIPRPSPEAHKYTRGHLLVIGGGEMTGAARLSAAAARRTGLGMLTIAAPSTAVTVYQAGAPGNLVTALPDDGDIRTLLHEKKRSAVLVGPGAGATQTTRRHVVEALKCGLPTLLDADALTAFEDDLESLARWIKGPCVMTPHAGEFGRLFENQQDKLSNCLNSAAQSGAVILLKGFDTVIAAPDGRAVINSSAPADLATAGAGDVLAGIIAGFLAQGVPAFEAAAAGAWFHGAAGQRAGRGLIAEDLPDQLHEIFKLNQ